MISPSQNHAYYSQSLSFPSHGSKWFTGLFAPHPPRDRGESNELGFSKSSFLPSCSLSPSPSHHSAVGPQFTHLPLAVSIHCLSHPSLYSTPAELWLSYPTLVCVLNSFSILLWGHLFLLSPSVYLLFILELSQELLDHLWRLSATLI